ncbi:MAG: hypothetical protein V2I63_05655 [Pseudomonadales bacterium]|nr:hypothetical protein [Pseudomonadales bacterium]
MFGSESDSLQADVMRFMAIIAFCLIAILGLAREAEQDAEAVTEPRAVPRPMTAEDSETGARERRDQVVDAAPPDEPSSEAELRAVSAPAPSVDLANEIVEPRSAPAAGVQPRGIRRDAVTDAQRPPAAVADPAPEPPSSTAPETARDDRDGLTLRFASDSDFLRLIARGELEVYAFLGTDRLRLDPGFRFVDAPAPGEVYEVLATTVPAQVSGALQAQRPDAAEARWAIRMPDRIAGRIRAFVDAQVRGALVIDRYGVVRHEEAADARES